MSQIELTENKQSKITELLVRETKIETLYEWFLYQCKSVSIANAGFLITMIILSTNIQSTLDQQQQSNLQAQTLISQTNSLNIALQMSLSSAQQQINTLNVQYSLINVLYNNVIKTGSLNNLIQMGAVQDMFNSLKQNISYANDQLVIIQHNLTTLETSKIPLSKIIGVQNDQLQFSQINSINSNQINGLIMANQINFINSNQINGKLISDQIQNLSSSLIYNVIPNSLINFQPMSVNTFECSVITMSSGVYIRMNCNILSMTSATGSSWMLMGNMGAEGQFGEIDLYMGPNDGQNINSFGAVGPQFGPTTPAIIGNRNNVFNFGQISISPVNLNDINIYLVPYISSGVGTISLVFEFILIRLV
jgi:hypothetical protein